jgi:signal transduction histidine kinase
VHRADPYFARHAPEAVLALPLVARNTTVGLLYLENSVTPDVFTDEKVDVLLLIAAQAAISLENAQLYGSLEAKVEERTAALRDAQAMLLALERKQTEERMAGGFAHEVRNAVAASQLMLSGMIGAGDGVEARGPVDDMREALVALDALALPEAARRHLDDLRRGSERVAKMARVAHRSGARVLKLTHDLLEWSRTGALSAGHARIAVGAFLSDLHTELAPTAQARRIDLVIEPAAPSLAWVAKQEHLHGIFSNLIHNALDAVDAASADRPRTVVVHAGADGPDVVVSVEDTGEGIAQADQSRIFDAFVSGKRTTGVGLGLAMVKRFVDIYGGRIDVVSEPGRGARFTVRLPRAASENSMTQRGSQTWERRS